MAKKYRYAALATVAKYYSILGTLLLLAGCLPGAGVVIGIAQLLQGDDSATNFQMIGAGFIGFVVVLFAAVSAWAAGQGIKLAMDCEDHLRHIRDQQRTAPASGQRRRSA